MKGLNKKLYKRLLINIVSLVTLSSNINAIENTLTDTQLHATLSIVTNFILSDSIIVHNGTSYGTVISPFTGRIWLDRNLGASRVCVSFNDAGCYGDYYQWGRNFDGHQNITSDTTNVKSNNDEDVGHGNFIVTHSDWVSAMGSENRRSLKWSKSDGSSVCPIGFRVPNLNELRSELLSSNSAQIGLDSTEKEGNSDDKRLNAFNSFLKLPSPGIRQKDAGIFTSVEERGVLASTILLKNIVQKIVNYNEVLATTSFTLLAQGISIRCIKN